MLDYVTQMSGMEVFLEMIYLKYVNFQQFHPTFYEECDYLLMLGL